MQVLARQQREPGIAAAIGQAQIGRGHGGDERRRRRVERHKTLRHIQIEAAVQRGPRRQKKAGGQAVRTGHRGQKADRRRIHGAGGAERDQAGGDVGGARAHGRTRGQSRKARGPNRAAQTPSHLTSPIGHFNGKKISDGPFRTKESLAFLCGFPATTGPGHTPWLPKLEVGLKLNSKNQAICSSARFRSSGTKGLARIGRSWKRGGMPLAP